MLIGVTGTNGKTSTTRWLGDVLQRWHAPTVVIDSLDYRFDGEVMDGPKGARRLAQMLARLEQEGGRFGVIECTSQALAQGYARSLRPKIGVFTNLSDDHLDVHGTVEHYLAAKAQLFVVLPDDGVAVLNGFDPASVWLDRVTPAPVRRLWYGSSTRGPRVSKACDLEATTIEVTRHGTRAKLQPSMLAEALAGELVIARHGIALMENALAVAAVALQVGVAPERLNEWLANTPMIPGRFEVVHRDPWIVVDYAHSPDALRWTLMTARALCRGQVWVVLGAGGSRSIGKREPMGAIAGQLADHVIVTNDNPRFESPEAIASAVERGVLAAGQTPRRILGRRAAIEDAIQSAGHGDIVVLAGRGDEHRQDFGDTWIEGSDRTWAIAAMSGRG